MMWYSHIVKQCSMFNVLQIGVAVFRSVPERLTVWCMCAVQEELENLLDDSGHLRTLAFLYASKGMSSKALAIWRVLARNYTSSIRRESASDNELQNRSSDTLNARETAASEASNILEESSDQNLVLQHFGWVCGNFWNFKETFNYFSTVYFAIEPLKEFYPGISLQISTRFLLLKSWHPRKEKNN